METDEELLESYQQTADMQVFGILYDRYITLVYGVCLKYLKNEYDAKDTVMQLFEETAEKVLQYDIKSFKSWLYVVAKNRCLMNLRKTTGKREISFEEKFMDFSVDLHLDKVMEDERKLGILNDCIDALPGHQKMAVMKFFMEELSYKDISDVTGNDLNKVKSFIQNGKRNLKICLESKNVKS